MENSNEMGDDLLINSSHSSASPGGCKWCSILQSFLVGGPVTIKFLDEASGLPLVLDLAGVGELNR